MSPQRERFNVVCVQCGHKATEGTEQAAIIKAVKHHRSYGPTHETNVQPTANENTRK